MEVSLFASLPNEIAGEICNYLQMKDIISLLRCNYATKNTITKNMNYAWFKRYRDEPEINHVANKTSGLLLMDPATPIAKWFLPGGGFCDHARGEGDCNGRCTYTQGELNAEECFYTPKRCWLLSLWRHNTVYSTCQAQRWIKKLPASLKNIRCSNPAHLLYSYPQKEFAYHSTLDYFKRYSILLFENARITSQERINLEPRLEKEGIEEVARLMKEESDTSLALWQSLTSKVFNS